MRSSSPPLEELNENFKEISSIGEKLEKKARYFQTESTHLVVAYIFFQAIIFLSISSKPSAASGTNWWVPFLLSLLISVIFFLTFASSICSWARMQNEYEMNFVEQEIIYLKISMVQSSGGGSSSWPLERTLMEPDMVKVYGRYMYIGVTVVALLGYSVLILRACFFVRSV